MEIYNLRQKLRRLKIECEELAKHGAAKPPSAQGLDSYSETPVEKGEFYSEDPAGKRDGNACCPTAKQTLLQTISDGMDLVHKVCPGWNYFAPASVTESAREAKRIDEEEAVRGS